MDFSLIEVLGLGGTGLATTLGVLALFWKADDAFSEEMRDLLAKKLQGLTIGTPSIDWRATFTRMFDHVFGSHHLSLRCFWRSCVASTLAVSVLFVLSKDFDIALVGSIVVSQYEKFFLVAVALNWIPDYISLLQTRTLLRILSDRNDLYIAAFLLVADLIFTVIIFCVFGFIGICAVIVALDLDSVSGIWGKIGQFLAEYFKLVRNGIYLDPEPQQVSFGVFLYSTLFTSGWLWLFLAGWLVIPNLSRFQAVLSSLQFALPIKTYPVRAIGEVAALLTAAVFAILAVLGVDFSTA